MKPAWWNSDHWATPPELMNFLTDRFGGFDLDPCCRAETAKARSFYTEADDGLAQPWRGRVFLNPPYSNPRPWLVKAWASVCEDTQTVVVALLPVRTDTCWFHETVLGRAELLFLKGRVRWIGWQGTPIPSPKNPSFVAVYRGAAQLVTVNPVD